MLRRYPPDDRAGWGREGSPPTSLSPGTALPRPCRQTLAREGRPEGRVGFAGTIRFTLFLSFVLRSRRGWRSTRSLRLRGTQTRLTTPLSTGSLSESSPSSPRTPGRFGKNQTIGAVKTLKSSGTPHKTLQPLTRTCCNILCWLRQTRLLPETKGEAAMGGCRELSLRSGPFGGNRKPLNLAVVCRGRHAAEELGKLASPCFTPPLGGLAWWEHR